ncbi:hypothetical protein FIBSPDRAFT_1040783 [Athelia psychrophila]|uniref:Uncharacterized protein n=1 Tax=Athelia psychrophila TaxID=1759441 RepID=A0A166PX03_9AGAM|nr:hypothetical protein FIBSPDRAFT_1040783 [Fibularhizoctonia sp. CBS 109695]
MSGDPDSNMPSTSFLALPSEMRLSIFEKLFQQIVISFGGSLERQTEPFAVLFACWELYHEARTLLKRGITLHFASTNLMLQVLLPMSSEDRSQFRHIRVKGYSLPTDFSTTYLPTALDMLSGLQLDTLLVEDVYHDDDDPLADEKTYWEVDALIGTNGWRQLLYYSPTSEILDWQFGQSYNLGRKAQPAEWQRILIERDENRSDGLVSLLKGRGDNCILAPDPHRISASEMISADDWERFEQGSFLAGGGLGLDGFLTKEMSRPLLVFAKRFGAYQQTGERLPERLRRLIDEFSGDWSRIRDDVQLDEDLELDPIPWL